MLSSLDNAGTIGLTGSGKSEEESAYGIDNVGTINEITNEGEIEGSTNSINNESGGQIGTSSTTGIKNTGEIQTIENAGTIGMTGGIGIEDATGEITTISNVFFIPVVLDVPICPPDSLFIEFVLPSISPSFVISFIVPTLSIPYALSSSLFPLPVKPIVPALSRELSTAPDFVDIPYIAPVLYIAFVVPFIVSPFSMLRISAIVPAFSIP